MIRILIADNEAAVRELRKLLEREKLDFTISSDEEEVWLRLRLSRYDILFLSEEMKSSGDQEMMAAVRNIYPYIKVILLTGNPDIESATRAIRGGAFDYIKKPCEKEDILRAVRNALEVISLDEENKRLLIENLKYQEQLEDIVQERTEALDLLSGRIIEIQEEERMRISREIHDDLGQSLIALKLSLQSETAALKNTSEEFRSGFAGIINYLNQIIEKSRRLSHNLSPIALESLGLSAAIRSLAEQINRDGRYRIFLDLDDLQDFFESDWNINVYRIVQESLTNIVKHSGATEIIIEAEKISRGLRICIKDNGKGFDPSSDSTAGIGLHIMNQRARITGAELHIRSSSGNGTEVCLELKKRPQVR